MNKLLYTYLKKISVPQNPVINRLISCSASHHQDPLTTDTSNRFFPEKLREESYSNEINLHRMATLLDGENVRLKGSICKVFAAEIMKPRYGISLREQSRLTHQRLKVVCESGLVSAIKILKQPQSIFATHELAAVVDPTMAFKMNAQFNWFAGTLLHLDTGENYISMLGDVDNLNIIGCVGHTELGHGNTSRKLETTAVYDHDTREITLDTPSPLAQKYWVTNGATQSKFMIVFAQLFVKSVNVGIHPFLVRIRDDNLEDMNGVHIEAMDHLNALNGTDAAKISFENVRIPYESLLNKYCEITSDGKYHCAFKNENQKYYVMCDELLTGKISMAAMCMGAAKATVSTAIRYSATRLIPGPTNQHDMPLLQDQLQQRALMPLLARTYALQFGLNYVQNRYSHQPANGSHHAVLVRLASAIKVLLSWHLKNAVAVCRERVGGQGFLSCNRFDAYQALANAAVSAEGDNTVLMQKIVRQYLTCFSPRKMTSPGRDFYTIVFLHELLNKKENLLFLELEAKVHESGKKGAFDLWVKEESDLVQSCGMAYAERIVSDQLFQIIGTCGSEEGPYLQGIHRLYILSILERDMGQILYNGIVSVEEASEIKYQSTKICRLLSQCALELVDAFGFTEQVLCAPIANDWVAYNCGDNKGEV